MNLQGCRAQVKLQFTRILSCKMMGLFNGDDGNQGDSVGLIEFINSYLGGD